ncbi:MAG: carboxymuconolactone decarboxylase, partial [Nitrospirae bacterium]
MPQNTAPTTDQILAMMEQQLGPEGVPPVMRRAARVMPELLAEHVRGKMWAMPPEGGALDE